MANILKILRSLTAGVRPAGHAYGEPYVNLADNQFGVVGSGGAGQDLIGVPFFSATATCSAGQAVNHGNQLWVALGTVAAGAWNAAQWSPVATQTSFSHRNMLINGDMRIDQRYNRAGIRPIGSKPVLDRWGLGSTMTAGNLLLVPNAVGSAWALAMQTMTAYTAVASDQIALYQGIEGNNIQHLQWGTANAQPVTVSFRIFAGNVTGNISVAMYNASANRSYVTLVPVTATETLVSVTIPGDTAGTWANDYTAGIYLLFDMGSGTTYTTATPNTWITGNFVRASGQTLNMLTALNNYLSIRDVQLEMGSIATPFERRSVGTEMDLCERYYQRYVGGNGAIQYYGYAGAGQNNSLMLPITPMRAAATVTQIGTWVLTNCTLGFAANLPNMIMMYITSVAAGGMNAVSPTNGGFDLSAEF